MRLTNNRKTILSYFETDNREWVTLETSAPPFDVSGVTFLLYGSYHNRYNLESTRRTLEAMVKDGLLERIRIRETRDTLHGKYSNSNPLWTARSVCCSS